MKHTMTAAALLALALGLSAAQTTPASPQPGSSAATMPTPGTNQRQTVFTDYKAFVQYERTQKALRALEGATRHAYDFKAQRALLQNPPEVSFLTTAQSLLESAQTSYKTQNFTLSEGQAKAAEDLYRAAEHVYAAQGIVTSPVLPPAPAAPRGPVGPGLLAPPAPEPVGMRMGLDAAPMAYDAPFRAQEELDKLGRELKYYGGSNAQIGELQRVARSLLAQSTQKPANQNTESQSTANQSTTASYTPDYDSSLAYADAAKEVTKAARHLLSGERGF